jgi:ring-1,2-phenylacetyl-CoA epoxidase subunit PaaE
MLGIYHLVKVVEIRIETPLAKTFVLAPVDDWNPDYKAGQFINLVFQTPVGEKRRSFSISSSKAMQEPLMITVKKLDNGEFSRKLIYDTRVGDIFETIGVAGFFTLPQQRFQHYFFLAAGSGISPIFALIKEILHTREAKVYLVYSNKNEQDAIFLNALKTLQQQYENRLRIKFLFSNRNSVYESRLSHWLLSQIIEEWIPFTKKETIFYTCGPFEYMLMVDISLRSNGITAERIIKENFNSLPAPLNIKPPDTDPHRVTILRDGAQFELIVQYPDSITKAAKKQGISLKYSCEAGRCGSCVATCLKGKVWMSYNEVLMEDEIEKGRVLTCTGFPIEGDVIIRY